MSSNPNAGGDIDARLQFLSQSTESLHASLHELHGIVQQHTEQIKENDGRTDRILGGIESLLVIVRSHQDRPDKLDGGNTR
jgi:hypothetical protein